MVTLNTEEIDSIKSEMAAGRLPPDTLKQHFKAEERRVFGEDVKHDRGGRPIEKGIGSKAQPSRNSIEAYRQWHHRDPDFEKILAAMEKELAEYEAKKRGSEDS